MHLAVNHLYLVDIFNIEKESSWQNLNWTYMISTIVAGR